LAETKKWYLAKEDQKKWYIHKFTIRRILRTGYLASHVRTFTGLNCGGSKVFGQLFCEFHHVIPDMDSGQRFKIVLYQPAFGHTVGGVELEAQMRMEGEDGAPKAMRAMDDRISIYSALPVGILI
jgi:hypothetical protein